MIKIGGLSGKMAVGKSHVAAIFNELGAMLLNTDIISKKVQTYNKELKELIINKFGSIYFVNNQINKEFAIPLFFSGTDESKENLKWITETVAPYVQQYITDYIKTFNEAGVENYILIESAILFETGLNKKCDFTIEVRSPNPVGAAYSRDFTSKEEWQQRMATQLPDSEKSYDYIINNDYTDAVKTQVYQVHQDILEKYLK